MKYLLPVTALILSLGLAACEQDGPAEDLGERIDNAAEDVQDAANDAGHAVEDAATDAGNAVEDACEDATGENC